MPYTEEQHKDVASHMPRDEDGHFISTPSQEVPGKNILSNFLHNNSAVSKTTDDNTLIDVHIGNPLRRISQLLEDIKKQKAFSFNIKGSLGLAGILVILTTFGIFGGTRALCSKGEQSRIGRVIQLNLPQQPSSPSLIQRAQNIWEALFSKTAQKQPTAQNRLVLVENDKTVFHILGSISANIIEISGPPVILTGDIDSCAQTITVKDPKAIQEYVY
jgi:hypothetical protein